MPVKQNSGLLLKRSPALPYVEMRRASRSHACYQMHSHDEFSFGVIDQGSADYHNRQHKNRIGAGTMVTINPGDAHSCNPDAGCWSYRMLFVEAGWLGQAQRELTASSLDYQPFPALFENDRRSFRQFDRLFTLLETESSPLLAESRLLEFFAPLFSPPSASAHAPKADQPGLKKVRELLLDQLDSNLSLDVLSQHSGLSRYHLIRSFGQVYGLSPHAYQLDQRIKKAKYLLRQGQALSQVALALGFADQAHFQRHFKRRTAISPGQYQAFFS